MIPMRSPTFTPSRVPIVMKRRIIAGVRGAATSARALAIRRPRPRGRRLIRIGLASLSPLALQYVKSGGGELSPVEFLEQRLERDDLAGGNSAREHRAQLLAHRFLAIVSASLGPVKIQRGESSARQLPEPGDFARRCHDDDLNRLRLRDAVQLRRGHRRLIENHRVRGGAPDIAPSHGDRLVVFVVAKGSQGARCFSGGGFVARHNQRRRRIEIIEQSPQRTGSGTSSDGDVLDDRHLVIRRYLGRFHIRGPHAPGAPGVALDQILHRRRQLAGDDDATSIAELAENCFEWRDGIRALVENVIHPGEGDGAYRVELEERGAHELQDLRRRSSNGENRPGLEDATRARGTRDGHHLDSSRPGKTENFLRNRESCFRIASHHHDLRASRRWIDAGKSGSQKFRNRLDRVRKRVDQTLTAPSLSGGALFNFLQFRHPALYFSHVA